MGSDLIPDRSNGQTMTEEWFDVILAVLAGDQVPRDGTCVPTSLAAALGSASLPFSRLHVASGGSEIGDVKMHHPYGGAATPGEGWMLCDGRQITKSNYDAEHGSGAWDAYVIGTSLEGLYLPNLTDRYAVGAASTAQTGESAITPVGNGGNSKDLNHNHRWFKKNNSASVNDQSFDSNGALVDFGPAHVFSSGSRYVGIDQGTPGGNQASQDFYTGNALAATDIKPESVKVQYYMRIA